MSVTDLLISICKFASIAFTGFFGVLALTRPYRDKDGQLTRLGRTALGGIVISFAIAVLSQSLELQRSHQQALAAQEKTQNELARFERLLHEVQRTSPLTAVRIKLFVDNVPDDICSKIIEAKHAADSITSEPGFQDLEEHHNVGADDEKSLEQSELDKKAIRPFIVWLATGRFLVEQEKEGLIALSLDNHFSALVCIGWVKEPSVFASQEKISTLPSGTLIGDEIDWWPSWGVPQRLYERKNALRPDVKIDVDGQSVILSININYTALDASLLRYARNSVLTAAFPDDIELFSWSPTKTGEASDSGELLLLPFDTVKVDDSVVQMAQRQDLELVKRAPSWFRKLRLEIIPNGIEQLSKSYDLSLTSDEEIFVGDRGDEPRGYVRLWNGHSR